MLGNAARSAHNQRRRIAVAAVAGVAALDVLAGMDNQRRKLHGQGATASGGVSLEKTITINCSPQECYGFWRDFERFPRFMKHVESIQVSDDWHMHWTVSGPAGQFAMQSAYLLGRKSDPHRPLPGAPAHGARQVEGDHDRL